MRSKEVAAEKKQLRRGEVRLPLFFRYFFSAGLFLSSRFPANFFVAAFVAFLLLPAESYAKPFRVGVIAPLSGPYAEYGAAVKNALVLAQEEHPNASIQFFLEDDRYDPKLSISSFHKLLSSDLVQLIFSWGNEPALTLAPLAEQRRVPLVVVAQHPKTAAGRRYVIRFINPAEDYSRAMHRYLHAKGLKRLLVLKTEISFFNILLETLSDQLESGESLKVFDSFPPGENDFRTVIAKLRTEQFDILGVYLIPPQVVEFYRQAQTMQFKPLSFGSTPFESKKVIEGSLGLMEGAVYAQLAVRDSFRERYVKRFHDDVQISYAANAYDFFTLCADLFAGVETMTAEDIVQRLAAAGVRSGENGTYRFRESERAGKYFEFPIQIKQISSGSIRTVSGSD